MASCYGNSNKEMPTDVRVVGNTTEQIKNRVKGRLAPANYTVEGEVLMFA